MKGQGCSAEAQTAGLEPGHQDPDYSSVPCYVTLAGKKIHLILKMTPFPLIIEGETEAQRRYIGRGHRGALNT